MSIFEDLVNKLKSSFAESLHEKLIYCQGYLEGDEDNEDLYNFIGYLLRSSQSFLTPSSTKFSKKCRDCKYYHTDVLFKCSGCSEFNLSSRNIYPDLFEKEENAKQ